MPLKITDWLGFAKMWFSPVSRYLIFHITRQCNARCQHCFYWKEMGERASEAMSLEEIKRFAANLEKLEIVNLCGAEPFLHKDLKEIAQTFIDVNRARIIAIPTNGIMTDRIADFAKEMAAKNPQTTFRLSVSIDALGERHDTFRAVKGCFDKACATLQKLCELKKDHPNIIVLTNTTFSAANQHDIMETLAYLRKNFMVDSLSLTLVRGDPRDKSQSEQLDMDIYKKAVAFVNDKGRKNFKAHPLSRLIWAATAFARNRVIAEVERYHKGAPDKRSFECYPVKRILVVEPEGEVKLCEPLDIPLGNLRDYDYDIRKILQNDVTKKWLAKVKNHECECTWECAIRAGILYNPREYPAMGGACLREIFVNDKAAD